MADQTKHNLPCCISHEFINTATINPNQIAVIHASGGARICKEWNQNLITEDPNFNDDDEEFFNTRRVSPSHPAFKGDEYFTYAEILDAVECLSRRIRRVLDGGDDPGLIRPTGYTHGKQRVNNKGPDLPNTVNITQKQLHNIENLECTPQILGIYMDPSVEYIVTVLSVLRCGEAFLPLDPSWPKKKILSVISSSTVTLILRYKSSFDTSDCQRVDESDWLADQSNCAVLGMCMQENRKEHFEPLDLFWPCESKMARNFCYLMYTSGSTGKPKGVCGTERGLLNRYAWMQELFPLHTGDILLFKTSISFIDHLQEFLSAILTCIPLVIPPCHELRAHPLCILDFVKAYCISRLTIVPSVMRAIFPALRRRHNIRVRRSLQVLVFSGEVLSLSLWEMLHKLLPETTILNLYGSTEVSGDCTYFNCKTLPLILETEVLSSVPIGIPIVNCDVVLVGEPNEPNEGEIYVGGLCTSTGYFLEPMVTALDYVKSELFGHCNGLPFLDEEAELYFRTGDFAKRLHTGDLVFVGRKDRTLKINGQRVALEEIEDIIREHPNVVDAAVVSSKDQGELPCLRAYIVLEGKEYLNEMVESSIRNWLVERLPPALIPSCYSCIKSLPLSSSGKVYYALLSESASSKKQVEQIIDVTDPDRLLQIKAAFADALKLERVTDNDDFFVMGGDSITAAQVAHSLGINMRMLYIFPSPSKLLNALCDDESSDKYDFVIDPDMEVKPKSQNGNKLLGRSLKSFPRMIDDSPVSRKYLKVDSNLYTTLDSTTTIDRNPWISRFYLPTDCSISRCNKVVYKGKDEVNDLSLACWRVKTPKNRKGSMSELWKVYLKSCVDASPLVVLKGGEIYIFIGAHSHIFVCVDGVSGFLRWEVKLEGRIECSAAILDDFSQVVVGCYSGNIYFLDFITGKISWTFHTGGEVKSQPVVDKQRNLIWCGSYDHHLYALDYKNCCCVYNVSCGGSIYGSPSIDLVRDKLYVASTKGRVTAISMEASPFRTVWVYELGSPVFGSLITSANGNVVCCLVDAHVIVLSSSGYVVWKAITGGPIFAGACISNALLSQALICSRNGSIYSFDLEEGNLLWQYDIGDPITSSAYVDENIHLISHPSYPPDRLVCICGSSGIIYLLRINLYAMMEPNQQEKEAIGPVVQEFSRIDLPGDIFSSPVMIGGRIFVGCRDDYMHCIGVEAKIPV